MGRCDVGGIWSMLQHAMLRAHDVRVHDIVKLRSAGPQYPEDARPPDEDAAKRHWKTEEHDESLCPHRYKGATLAEAILLLP